MYTSKAPSSSQSEALMNNTNISLRVPRYMLGSGREAAAVAALDRPPWPCYVAWRDIDSMPEEESGYVPRPVPAAGH